MTSYLDPAVQASVEMMTTVRQLKNFATQEKPQVPKTILSFLAALSIDLLPQFLCHVFCHSHLNKEAQAAELLGLVKRYAKKPKPDPRRETYEIAIAKATGNGKYAQVVFALPGRKVGLLRVAKVYSVGSEAALIQYRVISLTHTDLVGGAEELSPGRIEENGKEDSDYDHLSPATAPAMEPTAQVEDPQGLSTCSKPSTQSSDEPAGVEEKGLEETVKTCDALIDDSRENFLPANCSSNIETQPIWENLEVVQNPALAFDISEEAWKLELESA